MKISQKRQQKDTVTNKNFDFLSLVEETYKFYFVSNDTKLLITDEF